MESKNINIFTLIMIVVMCAFSIYLGYTGSNGKNGLNGKNAYELAVEEGEFSGSLTDYLKSLKGDKGDKGNDITIEDVYEAYLTSTNKTTEEYSFANFILDYYPESIYDSAEKQTLIELSTNNALRSTVDICYSYCIKTDYQINYLLVGNYFTGYSYNKDYYEISTVDKSYSYSMGVAAGSGVIYKLSATEAYIITNYHIAYVSGYTNDDNYSVFYNASLQKYVTGRFNDDDVQQSGMTTYISVTKFEEAPLSTHFLPSYSIYLNGYQDENYALSATFVGGSAENDIAVLKIENNEQNAMLFNSYYGYKQASLARSTNVRQGQGVVVVGNPMIPNVDTTTLQEAETQSEYVKAYEKEYIKSLCLTATDGVISNVSEYQKFSSLISANETIDLRLMRVSAAINAGNSGGGLYDVYGRLIGIVNGKIASSDYDNVGYAIPIDKASTIADKVIAECDGETNVSTSYVTLKKLGLTVENSTEKQDVYFDSGDQVWIYNTGVKVNVSSVSGINAGDIIKSVKIGSETFTVYHDYELADVLLKIRVPETSITIQFFIKGNETPVDVTITSTSFQKIK